MTLIARPAPGRRGPTHRGTAGVCLVAVAGLLSGCGGGPAPEPQEAVTVTITPTVTASANKPTPTVATTTATAARSDVAGRKFDLGTIVKVKNDAGAPVIVFDRWSVKGISDSTVAEQGVPIRVHSDAPYENQNTRVTYRIPVAQDATFIYTHCSAIDQPPVQKSSTLNDFARLPDSEDVVLLTLNPEGQAYKAQNDPAC